MPDTNIDVTATDAGLDQPTPPTAQLLNRDGLFHMFKENARVHAQSVKNSDNFTDTLSSLYSVVHAVATCLACVSTRVQVREVYQLVKLLQQERFLGQMPWLSVTESALKVTEIAPAQELDSTTYSARVHALVDYLAAYYHRIKSVMVIHDEMLSLSADDPDDMFGRMREATAENPGA